MRKRSALMSEDIRIVSFRHSHKKVSASVRRFT